MELSKQQKEIVDSKSKKIIVDAGSGSGKTRVLTERVRKLLNSGVNPYSVVVITFTNMAANELYDRLSDVKNSDKCFIGTIHAYAHKLLKKSGYDFDIFSEYYQTLYMTELLKKYGYYATIDDYNLFLKYDKMIASGKMQKSDLRNKFTDYKVYDELMALLGRVTRSSYKETVVTMCKENNVITFDELIDLATKYFKDSNTKLEYLFVDELQDIGYLEYNFLLSLNAENYFFIGDDYQCQPAGTKVNIVCHPNTDISEVKVGDLIQSAERTSDGKFCHTNLMKKVINVQKSISPEIYTVKTIDGRTSSYTPNHRCVVGVFDKETCNIHIEEVLAKNLNKYMYAIVIKNGRYMFDRIVSIEHVEKDTDVYCLEVDGGLYFADGMLTHNSIFSFKGGDVNIFLSLMHNEEWQPYFLTENYRTARSILMYANSIVQNADDIIKKDVEFKNENVGILEFNTKSQLEKFLSDLNPNDDWFILTRSNKEMSAIDSILKKLNKEHYCFKQSTTAPKKINEILSKPCIKVMTIHASKGLECDNVALYGKLPVKGKGQSEELKVYYVGITRSKDRCVIFV